MRLEGLLSLHRATTGTVALVTAGDAAVIAVATVAPNGRFALDWPPLPPGCVLYGFPGQELRAGEIADALADSKATIFSTLVPLGPTDRLILVNAISTCVCAVMRRDFAFGAAAMPVPT